VTLASVKKEMATRRLTENEILELLRKLEQTLLSLKDCLRKSNAIRLYVPWAVEQGFFELHSCLFECLISDLLGSENSNSGSNLLAGIARYSWHTREF
jgi:hypothetical protein